MNLQTISMYIVIPWEGGGTHIGTYGDVPPSRFPFSGHFIAPETHHFKALPAPETPHVFFGKILHFKAQFSLNVS